MRKHGIVAHWPTVTVTYHEERCDLLRTKLSQYVRVQYGVNHPGLSSAEREKRQIAAARFERLRQARDIEGETLQDTTEGS